MDTRTVGRSLAATPTAPRPRTSGVDKNQLRAWADAASGGDAAAFARLYDSCRGWVLARCRARLPVHEAEDACAEVFARAWRYLHAGHRIEYPVAWLTTVTRHLITDVHRRAGRAVPTGGLADDFIGDLSKDDATTVLSRKCDPSPGPAELAAVADIVPIVQTWLAELSPQARAAVAGYMSTDDKATACARLGCSVGALYARLYRARRQLRAALDSHGVACTSRRTGAELRRTPSATAS